jgi:hypothetical protein
LAPSQSYPGPTTILVDELDTGQLKRLSKHRKGRLTRFSALTLKQPNRSHADPGCICELLLGPVKEASGGSALGRCKHVSWRIKVGESGQFDCFSIDSGFNRFYTI